MEIDQASWNVSDFRNKNALSVSGHQHVLHGNAAVTDQKPIPERRPLATRELKVSIQLANWLAASGVSPNAISIAGMIAGLLSGAAFVGTRLPQSGWLFFFAAAVLAQLRLLANMLDGMVAIKIGRSTPVGELFNEVPDRISDTAIFIGAGYGAGSMPELGFAAALAAMFTAYVRAEGKVAGAHQEFCGPMAKPHRMALLTLVAIYSGLAPAAWQPRFDFFGEHGLLSLALLIICFGSILTSIRRLSRIARTLCRARP